VSASIGEPPGSPLVRPIAPRDDAALAAIIRATMTEFGATGPGQSIHDAEVDHLSESYRSPRAAYWVVDRAGAVLGGGGIGPLAGEPDTCELRKMYFLPAARGLGLGREIAERALRFARAAGYRRCYLETLERMTRARALYEKLGFARTDAPRGKTGHFGCDAWYEMDL